jgi:hypothetical protein
MSKIFGIGLPKTGTWSLCCAMGVLGFNSLHFIPHGSLEFYKSVINKYKFVNDCPISYIFESLSIHYPNSKFICTTRNYESWIQSSKLFFKKIRSNESAEHLNKLFKSDVFECKKFEQAYISHSERVKIFSKENEVLYLPLESKDKWTLICEFLNIKTIKNNYPWINKSKKFFL